MIKQQKVTKKERIMLFRHFFLSIKDCRFAQMKFNWVIQLTVLFQLFCLLAVGQEDSEYKRISKLPDSNNKIFEWINAANKISESAPKIAFTYAEEALLLSIKLKSTQGEAYSYNTFGALNYTVQKYAKSIEFYKKAIILFEGSSQEKGFYNSKKYIGAAYEYNKEYPLAITSYEQFLLLAKQKGNNDDIIFAHNGLARCYKEKNESKKAEFHLKEVFNLEEKRKNTLGLVNASDNLGNFYESINDSAKAFKYFDSTLAYSNAINYEQGVNTSYQSKNKFYSKRGNDAQQMQVQQQALQVNNANQNSSGFNESNLELGKLNLKQNNPTLAIPYLKKTINLSSELGELKSKEEALQAISKAYSDIGDYKSALESMQELLVLRDSIQEEKNKQALIAMNLSLELEQKEKEINLILDNAQLNNDKLLLAAQIEKDKNSSQLYIIYALIAGILILVVSSFLIIKSNKERAKANLLLELKSLRSQMNPHFIFNSLNSINSFIAKNDERSANKYLSRFSQLMRMVLDNSKNDWIPLEDEIKTIELYLELEHLRFEEQFDYTFTIDDSVYSTQEMSVIPPMLLQPLIENAIWHGLRYLDKKGSLLVSCKIDHKQIIWTIEDNGIGRAKSKEMKTEHQKNHQSTGMKNITERIDILNSIHKTAIQLSITDANATSQEGTKVVLTIPVMGRD